MGNHTSNIKHRLPGPANEAAQRLLGSLLVREIDGRRLVGRIVEVEAYDQADMASHSFNGRSPRNDVMFGPAGHLYVYFTYGMHYCCNVVTGKEGEGSAVLLRAIEPLEGLDIMAENRGRADNLCSGPARLTQALSINKSLNGHDLTKEPLLLSMRPALLPAEIATTPRIGITAAKDCLRRFYIKNNGFVSK